MSDKKKLTKRIGTAMVIILLLTCCLGITAYALFYATVKVEKNYFQTGEVDIELQFGENRKEKQIIQSDEYLFEPGMTVEKTFWVVNKSTCDVYYRLYFESMTGELANVMEIKIWDAESGEQYFEGLASGLIRTKMKAANDILIENGERKMKISFHYPEESGNVTQSQKLMFDLSVQAVQTKNNPGKQFE